METMGKSPLTSTSLELTDILGIGGLGTSVTGTVITESNKITRSLGIANREFDSHSKAVITSDSAITNPILKK